MATTNNKLINGSGLSELSSQIKSYVDNKSEIAIGTTAPTDSDIKIWVDTSADGTSTSSISWNDITDKPTIPTKVSALENDKGYLTEHQSLAEYSTTAQVQTMISSAIGAIINGNEVSY